MFHWSVVNTKRLFLDELPRYWVTAFNKVTVPKVLCPGPAGYWVHILNKVSVLRAIVLNKLPEN